MKSETRILGISGSLRHKSYNTAALRAAVGLAPEGVAIETRRTAYAHLPEIHFERLMAPICGADVAIPTTVCWAMAENDHRHTDPQS